MILPLWITQRSSPHKFAEGENVNTDALHGNPSVTMSGTGPQENGIHPPEG